MDIQESPNQQNPNMVCSMPPEKVESQKRCDKAKDLVKKFIVTKEMFPIRRSPTWIKSN